MDSHKLPHIFAPFKPQSTLHDKIYLPQRPVVRTLLKIDIKNVFARKVNPISDCVSSKLEWNARDRSWFVGWIQEDPRKVHFHFSASWRSSLGLRWVHRQKCKSESFLRRWTQINFGLRKRFAECERLSRAVSCRLSVRQRIIKVDMELSSSWCVTKDGQSQKHVYWRKKKHISVIKSFR